MLFPKKVILQLEFDNRELKKSRRYPFYYKGGIEDFELTV